MWLALFGSLFGLLLSGIWIGAALGITGILIMHFWGPGIGLLGSAAWDAINMYALTTLPGYMFMGLVIGESGIAAKIYQNVSPLTARFPGKLLHSNIVISAMFAAVLGSSSGNAAIVGSVAIPELRKRKYSEKYLLGSIVVAGTLGLMIPPSGGLILYGAMANVSIAALFAAGTIPGLILALGFMAFLWIKGTITPDIAPKEEIALPWRQTILHLLKVWPLVLLMVICVGPIYLGLATPPEGAGLGALGAIIVGIIFGDLNWKKIKNSLVKTTEAAAMIFFLVIGATILSVAVSTVGAPRALVLWVGNLPLEPLIVMIFIYIMYIIMGCFIDGISMMLVTIPFIVPVIHSLDLNPLWFGVMLILVIEIGLVTPPVGLNLFVIQGIGGPKTTLTDIFMGSIPFLLVILVVILLVNFIPEIAIWLPRVMGLS